MITILDPVNKNLSHEKVNSGFIYALSLAFPEETIKFYGDSSHIEAIKSILQHDGRELKKIEYSSIKVRNFSSFFGVCRCFVVLNMVFDETYHAGTNRLFFLTITPTILFVMKVLKIKKKFRMFKFTSVLHGSFETIANDANHNDDLNLLVARLPSRTLLEKYQHLKLIDFCTRIIPFIIAKINLRFQKLFAITASDKRMMTWRHSVDFRYIALSPHIIPNAQKYIDTDYLNISTVIMPIVFSNSIYKSRNTYVKFAIFGYGHSLTLHNLLLMLSRKKLRNDYEIRIIGCDNRGAKGFPNVTCVSDGRRLQRDEMEDQAIDIDIFLILYDRNRYKLSCSGSVFEALSYKKPIIHLDNECINYFNTPKKPIGYCCNELSEMVDKMVDIIENYNSYHEDLDKFLGNIMTLRKIYSIEESLPQLRKTIRS